MTAPPRPTLALRYEAAHYAKIIPALIAAGHDDWLGLKYELEDRQAAGIPRALAYRKRILTGWG